MQTPPGGDLGGPAGTSLPHHAPPAANRGMGPSDVPDGPRASIQPRDAYAARPRLAGSTILVVEDDGDTADLLQLVLEQAGSHVEHAATVCEVAAVLRELLPNNGPTMSAASSSPRIDLIVLDLRLGDGDGADMLLQLHSVGYRLPPVVVVSAASQAQVDAAARRLGARGVVYKPFNLARLLDCFESALQA